MRDYLLRIIEQFGMVWSRIVHFKQAAQHTEILAEVDQTYSRLFGRHAQFVDLLDDEGLVQLAYTNNTFDADRAGMLAALHVAEGDAYTGLYDVDAAYRRYERGLLLYAAIVRHNHSIPREMRDNARELLATLEHYDLEPPMLDDAWRMYAAFGDYAAADNHLWMWLEAVAFHPHNIDEGIAWYNQLLTKPDRDLRDGGLSREEITTSMRDLEAEKETAVLVNLTTTFDDPQSAKVVLSRIAPQNYMQRQFRKNHS